MWPHKLTKQSPMLHIYNSLTRQKDPFIPLTPGHVRMYVCGMTVYDYCHLGHARVLVVFDVVYRYLQAQGFKVTYVRNITDIDDKIIQRAAQNNEPMEQLTARFIAAMHEDAQALNILPPTHEPRATEHIQPILDMIEKLLAKGHAYQGNNQDIYYAVNSFKDYGKLSGRQLEDLRVGARVELDEAKRDPLDFVLWKRAKPGEPSWDSPWGAGRPGWHIECSAMSGSYLGQHFDIHGGGQDLQFPHHENEIAQSEASHDCTYVNYWMHNGFVRVNEEKMSKSLGNFFTVREILARYQAEEVRYFILGSHYKSPLNYGDEQLEQARNALTRLYTALRGLERCATTASAEDPATAHRQRFHDAMDDDFNTPEALAVLFELAHEINRVRSQDPSHAQHLAATLYQLGGILGLLTQDPQAYLQSGSGSDTIDASQIEALIAQRLQARADKNWPEADRIRDHLKTQGIILEDSGNTTTWRRL